MMTIGIVFVGIFGEIEEEAYKKHYFLSNRLEPVQTKLRSRKPEQTARVIKEMDISHEAYKKMLEKEVEELIEQVQKREGEFSVLDPASPYYISDQECLDRIQNAISYRQMKLRRSNQEKIDYIAKRKRTCAPEVIAKLKSKEKDLIQKIEPLEKHLEVWNISGALFWGRFSFWMVFVGLWLAGWSSRLGFWNGVIDTVIVAFPLAMLIGSFISAFLGF